MPAAEPSDPAELRFVRPQPEVESPFSNDHGHWPYPRGEFAVVARQSELPRETNPYVMKDGTEMVASFSQSDDRLSGVLYSTLRALGMDPGGSGGHGFEAVCVSFENAERARRVLMRLPGAEIALPAEVPEGQPGVFWRIPKLPPGTPRLELIAGTGRADAPLFDRASALVAAAGIWTQVVERGTARSLLVPTVRAVDARRLVGIFPGALEAPPAGPPPDGDLFIFPSPRVALPPAGPGKGENWQDVAFFFDSDALAAERVWGALDRAGISALSISNAGGASTKVGAPFADRARLILRLIPGARLERGYEEEVLGEFWIDGVDLPVRTNKRGKAPRPGPGREWVAQHGRDDLGTAHMLAAALEIGGFEASGAMDREEPVLRSDWIVRVSVPASEAAAARRMIRLLPGGERIVR